MHRAASAPATLRSTCVVCWKHIPPREQRLAEASEAGAGASERLSALAGEPLETRAEGLAELAEDLRSALRLAEG